MRSGTQEMLLGLRFGEDAEDINRQIAAHLREDFSTDRVLDAITAFAALSAAGWPGADKYFRLYVEMFPDLWMDELKTLPVGERAISSVRTLQALKMPVPAGVGRVAMMARRELTRRGFVLEEGAAE